MKRIEFIAPVEAMRGNLSGKQNLLYAVNNNPAYDAPAGKVNYARNYQPRFIGAKRAKDGLKYFAVKTKTATHLTAKALKQMAIMGATGAMVGAVLKNKTSEIYGILYGRWFEANMAGYTGTFRKFLSDSFMRALRGNYPFANVGYGPGTHTTVKNPWYDGSQTEGMEVSEEILAKFWEQLKDDGTIFYVDDQKGMSTRDFLFGDIVEADYNNLNISVVSEGGLSYAKSNGHYLVNAQGKYMLEDDSIGVNTKYTTTDETPDA